MAQATRDAYGHLLETELYKNPDIVVLDADLGSSTRSMAFQKVAPQRYFDMGISEQDMMGTAAGFAACGKIPLASTFAVFGTGRAFEQVRNSICLPNLNVKICATHAGISVGEDGATHQSVEDMAIMRSLPNMSVVCPADAAETEAVVRAAVAHKGPVYVRMGRAPVEDVYRDGCPFQWGKGTILRDGSDVAIIATGLMVQQAMIAADQLAGQGKEAMVIDMASIKPLDEDLVVAAAQKTHFIVTAEEHSIIGGLGGAVAETLSRRCPTRQAYVGLKDCFGESGKATELLEKYGLTAKGIVDACLLS
ncbi:transketolase family protein [uncultured Megasphaera sp.]|uniref:transketolase family protein n=1 Tax=uncultured Megasphaera sp. TaxID=165188 RepID=UPI0025F36B8C|nr:transketolase family protein [uncultured Megasphaera sp.]